MRVSYTCMLAGALIFSAANGSLASVASTSVPVQVDWNKTIAVSKTEATMMHMMHPVSRKGTAIHDKAIAAIRDFDAKYVRMGGPERTGEFARLFLVPGADHGLTSAGPSPAYSELNRVITQWVEEGHAPEQLNAELRNDQNKVIRQRFLQPHRMRRAPGVNSP